MLTFNFRAIASQNPAAVDIGVSCNTIIDAEKLSNIILIMK